MNNKIPLTHKLYIILKKTVVVIFAIIVLLYLPLSFYLEKDLSLNAIDINATITDEYKLPYKGTPIKYYPVYSVKYHVNNHTYSNNISASYRLNKRVGDTLCIAYSPIYPKFSEKCSQIHEFRNRAFYFFMVIEWFLLFYIVQKVFEYFRSVE